MTVWQNQSLRRTPLQNTETAYSLSEIDKSAKIFKSVTLWTMKNAVKHCLDFRINQSHFNNAIESISDSYTAYGTKRE